MDQADPLRSAALLAEFSAATVHEAFDRRGDLSPLLKPVLPGWRLCAPAMTVSTPPGSNLAVHQALYRTPPGWVLAVATSADRSFGYWGDILTTAAIEQGLAGLVIEGGVRDIAELREAGFPVFAGAHTLRGTAKLPGGVIGGAVSIGGTAIAPGDVLVGDDDGVVCVPAAAVPAVARAARQRAESEDEKLAALRGGATTLELYGFPAAETDPSNDKEESA